MTEPDAPQRRRAPAVDRTVAADEAQTSRHRSETTHLNQPDFGPSPSDVDAPVRLVRQPTELVDPPTRQMPSAPAPVSGAFESADAFDRVAHAAVALRAASENLDVDRRSLAAQLCAGIASGLDNGPLSGAIEHTGSKLVKALLLVDAGVGGRFTEDQLAQELIRIATEVIAGVEPRRRANRDIANDNDLKAEQYRMLATNARGRAELARRNGDDTTANAEMLCAYGWEQRADERHAHAQQLRRDVR